MGSLKNDIRNGHGSRKGRFFAKSDTQHKATKFQPYDLRSFHWSTEYERLYADIKTRDLVSAIPTIKITEFQPEWSFQQISLLGSVVTSTAETLKKSAKAVFGITKDGALVDIFSKGAVDAVSYMDINDPVITSKDKNQDLGISMYLNMFDGKFINQFILPYFEGTGFESNAGTWKDNESGTGSGTISQMNMLNTPTWDMPSETAGGTFTVPLINDTPEHLEINYEMLNRMFIGTLWYQNGFAAIAPNIYQIEIVDRMLYFFCSLEMSIEWAGKVRPVGGMNDVAEKSAFISEETLFPEVWNITFKWKSLTPTNYNNYLYYQKQRDGESYEERSTSGITDIIAKFMKKEKKEED